MTPPDRHYPAADSNLISSAHAFIDSEKSIPPDGQGLFGERLAGRNATSGQRNPQTENTPRSKCIPFPLVRAFAVATYDPMW